jgi:hypothetical protein
MQASVERPRDSLAEVGWVMVWARRGLSAVAHAIVRTFNLLHLSLANGRNSRMWKSVTRL